MERSFTMNSSLGFHTLKLSLTLDYMEFSQLIQDFKKYSQNTGEIQMYYVDKMGNYMNYLQANNDSLIPANLKISYYKQDKGIKWLIRCNTWNHGGKSYIVDVIINPKILSGISDYLTASTCEDMETAIFNFNSETHSISPILKDFDHYNLNRIDYCINFDLDELAPECNPERIIKLVKRSNIPPHYIEWTKYDSVAHRKKSQPGSFYLTCPSVNINCYSKYMQLQERLRENQSKGYPPIPLSTLDAARGIIRFEVQCKYHKTYILSCKAAEAGNHSDNKYKNLLSNDICNEIIDYYFEKIIGYGDWYTFQDAIHKIQSHNYNKQKENRLIDVLRIISENRSIDKAKNFYQGNNLKTFQRTLKDLSILMINPVTIPKEWGIRHIPNLLHTYFEKQAKEKEERENKALYAECLEEYIKEFGHLPL